MSPSYLFPSNLWLSSCSVSPFSYVYNATLPHVFEFLCVPEFLSFLFSFQLFYLASFLSALLSLSFYPYLSYLWVSPSPHHSISVAAFIGPCSLIFLCSYLSVPISVFISRPLTFTFLVSVSVFLLHIHTFVGFLAPLFSILFSHFSVTPFLSLLPSCWVTLLMCLSCLHLSDPLCVSSVHYLVASSLSPPSLSLSLTE